MAGQRVEAGGGDVVHRARLGVRDPQREPVRGQHRLHVPGVGPHLAAVPQVNGLYFVLYAAPFLARPGTVLASSGRLIELVVRCLARAALIMFLA